MIKKVLIVSHNDGLAEKLVLDLEREGGIAKVCNCTATLSEVANTLPGVVIIDGALPGKDSLRVCRRIKESRTFNSVPVIMLGQAMNARVMSAAYQAGAEYFVLNQGEDRRALMLTIQSVFKLQVQENVYQAQ